MYLPIIKGWLFSQVDPKNKKRSDLRALDHFTKWSTLKRMIEYKDMHDARTHVHINFLVICVQSSYDLIVQRVLYRRFIFFMERVVITDDIRKQYINALYNLQSGSKDLMNVFILNYPKEYKLIMTMYRKRVDIKNSVEVLKYLNEDIYWFTLTFNNRKDTNSIKTKRREAQMFLSSISLSYLMVEEFGEDNGRYHIHGFLCFKYGKGFEDFQTWHSRQNIVKIDNPNKKIKYLTNYSCKSIPRIRRSKSLSVLYTYFKKNKRLSKLFPSTFQSAFNKQVANIVNPF